MPNKPERIYMKRRILLSVIVIAFCLPTYLRCLHVTSAKEFLIVSARWELEGRLRSVITPSRPPSQPQVGVGVFPKRGFRGQMGAGHGAGKGCVDQATNWIAPGFGKA